MFKLIHISDVHLAPLPKPSFWQLCSKRITGYVNWRMKRAGALKDNHLKNLVQKIQQEASDHLVVTGDLVNLALPQEFSNAQEWLKNLGDAKDVSVILGNHDAYLPSSFDLAIQHFKPYMTSDDGNFNGFPYMRVRQGVALIGINSAEATLPFMATGYFRKKQAEKLRKILEDCEARGLFRLVMIHHPPIHGATPKHKRLIGIDFFQEVIRQNGAELILHGHTHLNTLHHILGKNDKQVPVLCVPAAGQAAGGHKPEGRYNLLEIEEVNGQWQCNWTSKGLNEDDIAKKLF